MNILKAVYSCTMPTPLQRRQRIAELIARETIRTQDELQHLLERRGISATQATLSRDLRAMGVAKSPGGYVLPGAAPAAGDDGDALARALRSELVSVEPAGTLVVLRTRPGHANALGIEVDRSRWPQIAGTIAGDDTVFVAARSGERARQLADRFRTLAGLQ
jgi:transcriptional regulator of arginine metabolism